MVKKRYYGVFGILVLVGIGAAFLFSSEGPDKVLLAECLSEKGFSLAGTSWCPHCADQRDMFGDAIDSLDYHDCEEEPDWCREKGITAYPSWITPYGSVSAGVKSLSFLEELSGC